jgi:hypothetical protein
VKALLGTATIRVRNTYSEQAGMVRFFHKAPETPGIQGMQTPNPNIIIFLPNTAKKISIQQQQQQPIHNLFTCYSRIAASAKHPQPGRYSRGHKRRCFGCSLDSSRGFSHVAGSTKSPQRKWSSPTSGNTPGVLGVGRNLDAY